MKKLMLLFSMVSLLFFFGCDGGDKLLDPECDGSTPTYDVEIKMLISENCLQCHGDGSERGDFTTYAGLEDVITTGKLEQRVLIDQTMPKDEPLTQAEIDMMKCWIDNDYPEN